jgi:arylformamidase
VSKNPEVHPPYSPDFCDREYNARAAIRDHPRILARWTERGALTRRQRAGLIDVPYGASEAERLDFFPTRREGAPLLVYIHGGYWRALDKADFSWVAPPFLDHGVAVAVPNYGLAPAIPIEEIVRQMLRALAWLYRNADDLGFDPQRIVVAGHSAGGHLAAMMLAARWPQFADDLPPDLVKSVLAVSGLFDLEPLVYAPFVNVDLHLDVERARLLSPARLTPATEAPVYTAVGARESSEFRRQTALLRARWPRNVVRDVPMAGFNHLTVCEEVANPGSPLFDAALELVLRPVHRAAGTAP